MSFPLSRALVPRLEVVESTPSTNADLVAAASEESLPEHTAIVTLDQTAGRGRLGRTWTAPAGRALAVSVLLRPRALEAPGLLPLVAGLAMRRAVAALRPDGDVGLKWPNDVQIDGLKVSGILAELTPGGAVVMGAGLNLFFAAAELPTPTSTSLTLRGVAENDLADRALAGYLGELLHLTGRLVAGDDLHDDLTAACSSLGRDVRVLLPGGGIFEGVADRLERDGRLLVRGDSEERVVSAGDVEHLRH